ncbi:TRAP transporter large permease [Moorellaceae bacterium AZ2]
MSHEAIIGLVCFILMIGMVLVGIPIFISMGVMAFIGFWLIGGPEVAWNYFTTGPYNIVAQFSFAVLPMFLLMGVLAGESGVGEGAYEAARKWLGRLRGGLLMATIGGNALFGACCGVSIAGNVIFGKLALPELEKYGYDRRLSLGCITAAGALSSLIPPSMGILIFSILTNVSVGRALVSGIVPGLITAAVYCAMIRVIGAFRPELVPAAEIKVTWAERLSSLKLILPILGLFFLVIGGMFFGVFPATVGGAIGSFGVLIYALARRMEFRRIGKCFWDAAVMNAQFFPIIVSGFLFSRFVALSGLAQNFADLITQVNLPPLAVFWLVVIFYIFCGCVMDLPSIIIITIPIVFPLLTGLGFDPYVIVITLVFMGEIAGLTPPIGMNVFAVSALLRISPDEIFRGVWPFFIADVLLVALFSAFPVLVTFLPNLLYR